ncbi:MAG: nucleoside deaminase [Opitutales bacterium]
MSDSFATPPEPTPLPGIGAPPCPFDKLFPSQLQRDDDFYMKLAYNQAIDAWRANEVPVGAVIEYGGEVIAAAHNRVASAADPTAHAEILALTQAARAIGDWRLNGARLFVTKEPCPMCSGACIMARLREVVFAVGDPKMGCLGGATALQSVPGLNHRLGVRSGVLEAECRALLQAFFQAKRKDGPEVDGHA